MKLNYTPLISTGTACWIHLEMRHYISNFILLKKQILSYGKNRFRKEKSARTVDHTAFGSGGFPTRTGRAETSRAYFLTCDFSVLASNSSSSPQNCFIWCKQFDVLLSSFISLWLRCLFYFTFYLRRSKLKILHPFLLLDQSLPEKESLRRLKETEQVRQVSDHKTQLGMNMRQIAAFSFFFYENSQFFLLKVGRSQSSLLFRNLFADTKFIRTKMTPQVCGVINGSCNVVSLACVRRSLRSTCFPLLLFVLILLKISTHQIIVE